MDAIFLWRVTRDLALRKSLAGYVRARTGKFRLILVKRHKSFSDSFIARWRTIGYSTHLLKNGRIASEKARTPDKWVGRA